MCIAVSLPSPIIYLTKLDNQFHIGILGIRVAHLFEDAERINIYRTKPKHIENKSKHSKNKTTYANLKGNKELQKMPFLVFNCALRFLSLNKLYYT